MWCIPTLTPEYIERMEYLLDLYALPYNPAQPVVCIDEKSKQLLGNIRTTIATTAHADRKVDSEYQRKGTRNIFCAVEPKGGYRKLAVTARRTKKDFAHFVCDLLDGYYAHVDMLHIVCDNLNTHFEKSFTETFGQKEAQRILSRIQFHYTPTHASWLDMAEIELSILSRTAIKGRLPTEAELVRRVNLYEERRNAHHAMITWKFTKDDARKKMKYEVQN